MANILLLDDQEVAGRAMRGILARGNHRCLVATQVLEAWKYLREAVRVDLVIVEVGLKEEDGFGFIQRLRDDSFFRTVPVTVYTAVQDHNLAKRSFALKAQAHHIKPYSDSVVNGEVAKACANPWRDRHFEEEKSFCAQMGLKPAELRGMLQQLHTALELSRDFFVGCADGQREGDALARISSLSDQAQAAGYWGVVEYLEGLRGRAEANDWLAFKRCNEDLAYAARLLFCRLNPSHNPEALLSDQEKREREEERGKAIWQVDVMQTGPVMKPEQVWQQLNALQGFPVVDTVAAGFQMVADGRTQTLTHVMELAYRDPGLAVQMLVAANRLERDDQTSVDDPRVAVSLLGNLRLQAMAKSLPLVEERRMNLPPVTWSRFAMFQLGVARVADYTCRFLEYNTQVPLAYTAGLLHDIGKLLLLRLYPFGFHAIVAHAQLQRVSMHEAERRYLGCTSREMAAHFAQTNGLPKSYCNVIRWVETPDAAEDDMDLVAVVSLARDLCLHNHIGFCGDTPRDECPPVVETAAWRVLQRRVFTGFDLQAFETQVRKYCRDLRQELLGHHTELA